MTINDILKRSKEFQFQLLSRLKMDLNYYFGHGGLHEKHLWAGDIKEHLEYTETLLNILKPEWFTREELQEYKEQSEKNTQTVSFEVVRNPYHHDWRVIELRGGAVHQEYKDNWEKWQADEIAMKKTTEIYGTYGAIEVPV